MWSALRSTIVELVDSKKVAAAVTAAILNAAVPVLASWAIELTPEQLTFIQDGLNRVTILAVSYILGQSGVDIAIRKGSAV